MNDQIRDYLLYGVAALTVINSYFVFTQSDSGRVIETPSNTALVESSRSNVQASAPLNQEGVSKSFDAPTGITEVKEPQNVQPAGPPTNVAFAQMEHDFGTIDQNTENRHVFKFINTGPNPLIIQDAKGSCGCTVPNYPKEPVAPGEEGEIEVVYKPGTQKGQQTKTVTLTANTQPEKTTLKITAMVEEVKQDS